MPLIELQGPDGHQKLPPTTDETPESGWSFKRIVAAINEMFAELYQAVSTSPNPLDEFTVDTVPDAAEHAHRLIFVSDGAEGAPIVAFSDGTAWLRCDTRAEISGEA